MPIHGADSLLRQKKRTPDWFIEANLLFVIQDQVSNLIRNVRSSRIFEPSFDANRSFESDFIPSTGMQKSCTASSIVDLGNRNCNWSWNYSSLLKRKWINRSSSLIEKRHIVILIWFDFHFRQRESGERGKNWFLKERRWKVEAEKLASWKSSRYFDPS